MPQRYDYTQAFLLQVSGLLHPLESVQLWPIRLNDVRLQKQFLKKMTKNDKKMIKRQQKAIL